MTAMVCCWIPGPSGGVPILRLTHSAQCLCASHCDCQRETAPHTFKDCPRTAAMVERANDMARRHGKAVQITP